LVLHYYWCDGYIRGGTGDELPMRPLLAQGVASLCVNTSAVHQVKQDPLANWKIAQSGLTTIVKQLARQGLIDRRKVGMQGLSFGSEVTTWMATQTDLLTAAALASGQLEPATYWFEIGKGKDYAEIMQSIYGLGDPDRVPEDWHRLSAARHADLMKPAMLMQLPESEAKWSIELSAKLARSSTPFEFYVFPNAPHIKSEPRQKLAAYERNMAWFAFWLGGRVVIDPADPGRVDRWRAMAATWHSAKVR
ncbi:MAG: prolyl oligopeptidase family serine peptidase, partial [Pseudomonadota bacterium]|nr:prolyl oligopeptidase family serine peptidase [Pseudomonadota bacterium]